jgi:hypothetical protein
MDLVRVFSLILLLAYFTMLLYMIFTLDYFSTVIDLM